MTAPAAAPHAIRAWLARALVVARDASLLLGALEALLLFARAPGARVATVAPALVVIAVGAIAPFAWVLALPVAILPPRTRWARIAAGLTGLAVLVVAFAIDATAYVRLYTLVHAALGAVVVLGAVLARAALRIDTRRSSAAVVSLVALCALAVVLLHVRQDARALAAQRGVLLADVFEVTRGDVDALPPLPPLARSGVPAVAAPVPRPALVLLVTIDALRYDAALSPTFRTLTAIREHARRFRNARTTAAWTVPATYALMTGRGPWRTHFTRALFVGDRAVRYLGRSRNPRRVWPLPLDDRATTLAETLGRQGFRTRTCASMPFQVPGAGLVRGFDGVDPGVYLRRNRDLRGTTSDMLTACGIHEIEEAHGQPLFLWLHYTDPHEPYAVHPDITLPDGSPEARYAGEVEFVDRHVGGLLLNVDRLVGLAHTVLVVTADHGEEFGEHGGSFHAVTLYDEIEHVPLFVVAPGVAPGDDDTAVSLIDVAPTLLDLLGLAPLDDAEGRSLAPILRGGSIARAPVFAETIRYGRAVRSVVDGPLKLIYEARARTFELYDLAHDPREQRVLTDERPADVARLAREMGLAPP